VETLSGNRHFVVLGTEVINTHFLENMSKNESLKLPMEILMFWLGCEVPVKKEKNFS
jgi:hypothetical protein